MAGRGPRSPWRRADPDLKPHVADADELSRKGKIAMRRIAVMNSKGGSGKTTTATSLAVGMARRGLRVLLADADSQSNATMTMLDGNPADPPTLGNVLLGQVDVEEAIRPTRIEGLDLLPSDARLADAALMLADQIGREHRFRRALDRLDGRYAVAVVDCPPALSLVSVNVLAGVGELVVPVDAGVYAIAGLAHLQQAVADVREYLGNRDLKIAGLLLTRTHPNRATRDIADQLRAAYGPLVYRASIPHSVRVEEAHARNLTVAEFAPKSAPAMAYDAFISEVLGHGGEQQGDSGAILGTHPTDDPGPGDRAGERSGRGRGKRRAG
jgi:chromosome partitioning protein